MIILKEKHYILGLPFGDIVKDGRAVYEFLQNAIDAG
jgi:hypothetical protein